MVLKTVIQLLLNKTNEQVKKEIFNDLNEVEIKKFSSLLENGIATRLTFIINIQECFKVYVSFDVEYTKDCKIMNITPGEVSGVEYTNKNCKQFENEIKNERNKIFESFIIKELEIKEFQNNLKKSIENLNNICNKCN